MDISDTIVPLVDQLNTDVVLAGPRIIKITAVNKVACEQPIHLQYEGGTGRPYKPGKSMRRILVGMWGTDGAAYVGKRLRLYAEQSVRFGGKAVRRNSHLSRGHSRGIRDDADGNARTDKAVSR